MSKKYAHRAPDWWRGAYLYQIYPRSFLDTNGDGVGDLPGITEKLDHVASLGVDGIWISPFFTSPMYDYGYDVMNYREIDPLFGTMADFDAMLEKAHKLGLKIIIDLVLSHTSYEHPWFRESRRCNSNPRSDWYIWADPRPDGTPPNNWQSVFGGPSWTFNTRRQQFYMHNFLKEQPDLNYHNPEVQEAALDIMRFWLEKGVDGFRMDTSNFYFHDKTLRDNPPKTMDGTFANQFDKLEPYVMQEHIFDKSRPENLDFIRKMRKLMDEYPNTFMVGEVTDDNPYQRAAEYTTGQELLHTTYNFDIMSGIHKELTKDVIMEPFKKQAAQPGDGWPSWAFSNHDVVRAASRWHPDTYHFNHDPRLSKLSIMLLGCLRGSIYMFQGEELGLPEANLEFEDLQDPQGKYLWPEWQGRDGCRTPIPWDSSDYCGFSKAKPWLPVQEPFKELTVEKQEKDPNSVLNFTREALKWRATQPALKLGDLEFVETPTDTLLAFKRSHEGEVLLCVFNLSRHPNSYLNDEISTETSKTVFGKEHQEREARLGAYEFSIIKLQ